jgi:hypothetical protein
VVNCVAFDASSNELGYDVFVVKIGRHDRYDINYNTYADIIFKVRP